jgi:hypothetical protein
MNYGSTFKTVKFTGSIFFVWPSLLAQLADKSSKDMATLAMS